MPVSNAGIVDTVRPDNSVRDTGGVPGDQASRALACAELHVVGGVVHMYCCEMQNTWPNTKCPMALHCVLQTLEMNPPFVTRICTLILNRADTIIMPPPMQGAPQPGSPMPLCNTFIHYVL